MLGLVYAGAMIVLLAVAFYLAGYSLWYAVGALILEALFLLMLAIITAYSAAEETNPQQSGLGAPDSLQQSMNSSIREMTNAVSDLFRLISQTDIRQDVLLTRLTENLGKQTNENTRKYSERVEQTNALLRELTEASKEQRDILRELVTLLQKNGDRS